MNKKKIILGVSSSIAAYKSCDLSRIFIKNGYDVHIVLTENALELVTPLTFETITGNPVFTKTFVKENRKMGHISLKENADLLLVAPATANIIAKFSSGIADDLLSTTYLSVECPVLIAPAMNPVMWKHPATQHNISILKSRGVNIIEPASGHVICGDEGTGKLANIEDIYAESIKYLK